MAEAFVADPVAPERLSMSFLRAAEGCLRRAHAEREEDVAGEDAQVGRLFHEVAATVGFACVHAGEERPQLDDALATAERVLARLPGDGPYSIETRETVLDLTRRWAPRAVFRPGELFEVLSRQELVGRTLSARLDRIAVENDVAYIEDYKTGWGGAPPGLTLQGRVYAWHAYRLIPSLALVVFAEDHVRFNVRSGPFEVTIEDIAATEAYLRDAIARVDAAYAAGGPLEATPGSACASPSRCPVASSCPVAEWARAPALVTTDEEALEEFGAALVEDSRAQSRRDAIKAHLLATGSRALVLNGEEIGWPDKTGSRFDKKALAADLEAKGAPVDLAAYERQTTPSFGRRRAA